MPKFTVRGDEALDARIEEQLAAVSEDVVRCFGVSHVAALVLGGGYGRGEGGALATPEGYRPYNDYDLVMIHDCPDAALVTQELKRINQEHTKRCNIHVDVMPLLKGALGSLPRTLTWCELSQGHHVIYGDDHVLEAMGRREISDLPDSEWGRLLFNRGSGLLFSIWALQGKQVSVMAGEGFDEFTTRQVGKAWLSLGDVWLAERGAYSSSVVKRRESWLEFGDGVPAWSEHYLRAIDFKLAPTLERPRAEVLEELFQLAENYPAFLSRHAASESRPLVGTHATLFRMHPSRWLTSRPWQYPRERLRRALVAELAGDVMTRSRLVGTAQDYVELWEKYA